MPRAVSPGRSDFPRRAAQPAAALRRLRVAAASACARRRRRRRRRKRRARRPRRRAHHPRTLPSTAPRGRWGPPSTPAPRSPAARSPSPRRRTRRARRLRPAYRLRDGKAGAWTPRATSPTPPSPVVVAGNPCPPPRPAEQPLRAAPRRRSWTSTPPPRFPVGSRAVRVRDARGARRANAEDVEDAGLASPRGLGSPASIPPSRAQAPRRRRAPSPRVSATPNPRNPRPNVSVNTPGDGSVPWDQMSPPPRRGRLRTSGRPGGRRDALPFAASSGGVGRDPRLVERRRAQRRRENPSSIGTRWRRTAPRPTSPTPRERLGPSSPISTLLADRSEVRRERRRRTEGVSRNGLRRIARGAHARDIRGGIVRGGDDRRR